MGVHNLYGLKLFGYRPVLVAVPKLPNPEPVVVVPNPPKPAVLVVAVFVLPKENVARTR